VVFGRLLGQETEYAIRFSPERRHPGNDVIYDAISRAIAARVTTAPGMYSDRPQVFTQNGGAFHYECLPYCSEGGLLEGATPECRGPAQLLLYQKAQEALLNESLPHAEASLRGSGYPGKLGLLKNCRDAEGHVYGAQENFQVSIATGFSLWLYRAGIVALLPLLLASVVTGWIAFVLFVVLVMSGVFLSAMAVMLKPLRHRDALLRLFSREDRRVDNALGRFQCWLSCTVAFPFITAFSLLLHLFAFRRIRRQATAFLISRSIVTGAGTVEAKGGFLLSEKASSIRRRMRFSILPNDRAIFDTGNLMKPAFAVAHLHPAPFAALFGREQRLQLGLADSSMLQETEFLKAGATVLVLDMVEAGFLGDAPRILSPIEALHAFASDPTLETKVATDRGPMSAIEIQKYYLERATAFARQSSTASIEAKDVIELWEKVLHALERREMASLVGRLDWVTKRYLLEACSGERDPDLLKTIDLRYHELSDGYAARLERSGTARTLLDRDDVERAMRNPPEGTPAFTRGRFIGALAPSLAPVRISWDSARIGGRLKGRVVPFPNGGAGRGD
jgi:proteasome accessory factor A